MGPTLTAENTDLIRRAFEAWNAGDREGFAACHADDVVLHGSDGDVRGLADVMATQWGFFDSFSDTVLTLHDAIAENDTVALRYTATGTHDGPFEGIDPTGETVELSAMAMVRVVDGAMSEKWIQLDALGLLDQIGAIDPPTE